MEQNVSGDMDRRKLLERGIGLGAIALSSPVAAKAVSVGKSGKTVTPDATEIAAMIRRKDVTALEVIDQAIARAEAIQAKLNFLVTPTFERARDRAKTMPLTGAFAGVPYLIKDMYDTVGATTRYGSRATKPLPPAASQGVMMNTLESAGLISIGKSALGEFGFLPTVEPLAFGANAQPVESGALDGGILRWIRRSRGGRRRPHGRRCRWRRVDPHSRLGHAVCSASNRRVVAWSGINPRQGSWT
jgi:hypothetical protein